MPLWDKTSSLPKWLTREQKRSVIATDKGFVRRQIKTDSESNVRIMDQLLVAIRGLANSTNFGTAFVEDVWHDPTTAVINTTVVTRVSYSEPITFSGLSGALQLTIANTAGGNNMVAVVSSVTGSNNTLEFSWKPSVAGTFKVQAQTMANTSSANLVSLNAGNELVSFVIGGSLSNTAGTITVTAS